MTKKYGHGCLIILGAFFIGSFYVFAAPTTDGLVGYWNFDEESIGGTDSILDSAGTNHGTPDGTGDGDGGPDPSIDVPDDITIESHRSLAFDGSDDRVLIANPFDGLNDFTIAFWINLDTIPDAFGNFNFILRPQIMGDGGYPPSLAISDEGGALRYSTIEDNLDRTEFVDNIENFFTQTNEWVHVAWVKDGATYNFYKNGKIIAAGLPAPTSFYNHETDYYIGATGGLANAPFHGKLDDFRVYNRALGAEEVAELGGTSIDPLDFPIQESFDGEQPDEWVLKNDAAWGSSQGADQTLLLTTNAEDQQGIGFYDASFPSNQGIVAEFSYYANGGGEGGADGLAFFLVDGDQVNENSIAPGAFGGSLGYAQSDSSDGVPHAYLGVGFDEYGNFVTSNQGKDGGAGTSEIADTVALRGSGNERTGYTYLTHTSLC